MRPVELLYARNVIIRRRSPASQELFFLISVQNITYEKTVEVLWEGEEIGPQILPAAHLLTRADGTELWRAVARFPSSEEIGFPGDIRFHVRATFERQSYHDDNLGARYELLADSGALLGRSCRILNIDHRPFLHREQKVYRVSAAVDRHLKATAVHVRWSRDSWKTHQDVPLVLHRNYWDRAFSSNARNPNRQGVEVWSNRIHIESTYRLEYALHCDTPAGRVWDSNAGKNFVACRASLKVLTLNLHCYQEEGPEEKLETIARGIMENDVDIVCLQEVGEEWNGGAGNWATNAAGIIRQKLGAEYNLYHDWAHLGFDRYREGVAILARFPVLASDSAFLSKSRAPHDIHTRKAAMAQLEIPFLGRLNVFSVHLSWWKDGFAEQFATLRSWVGLKHQQNVAASLVCGDFNARVGSEGYAEIVSGREFSDEFLAATLPDRYATVFDSTAPNRELLLADDARIDFVFQRKGGRIRPISAKTLFTDVDYGRVSDHPGYLVEFEIF